MPDMSQLLLTDIFSCIIVSGISCAHQAKNHKFHPFDPEEYKYIADTVISLELSRLAKLTRVVCTSLMRCNLVGIKC